MSIACVITSCGRPDLLQQTISSLRNCSFDQKIIIEDSADENTWRQIENLYSDWTLINNEQRMGQFPSIKKAYSLVETDFVFHCEDDWDCRGLTDIVLKNCVEHIDEYEDYIGQILFYRNRHRRVEWHPSSIPGMEMKWSWDDKFNFSFNPHVIRTDVHDLIPSELWEKGAETEGLISEFLLEENYRCFRYNGSRIDFKHLGEGRHVY